MINAYVINMDKDISRMNSVDKLLKNIDIPYERFSGINGKEFVKNENNVSSFSNIIDFNKLSPSEVGCFLSHYTLWKRILKNNSQNDNVTIIFEDDITTYGSSNIKEMIVNATEKLKGKYDILYLGKCLDRCSKYEKTEVPNVYKTFFASCNHAYIISKKGIMKILDYISKNKLPKAFDCVLVDLMDKGYIDAYTFHPSIFVQDVLVNSSNLIPSIDSYDNAVECLEVIENHHTKFLQLCKNYVTDVLVFIFLILALWYLYRQC
jgi:glycosyl transferase, family 25